MVKSVKQIIHESRCRLNKSKLLLFALITQIYMKYTILSERGNLVVYFLTCAELLGRDRADAVLLPPIASPNATRALLIAETTS